MCTDLKLMLDFKDLVENDLIEGETNKETYQSLMEFINREIKTLKEKEECK